jgi:DivIVA domain-containing protein
MPLTPEDVHGKQFTSSRLKRGYDEDEVDGFLDEVEAELTRLLREQADLRNQLAAAEARATAAPAPAAPPVAAPVGEGQETAALRTLLLAQRTADEAVAEARQEAEEIVTTARTQAAETERAAQSRAAAATAALEADRKRLEAQVEDLRAFEREYRTRLKAYLEGQLRDLDGRGAGEAPGARQAVSVPPVPAPTGGPDPSGAARPASPFTPSAPRSPAGGVPTSPPPPPPPAPPAPPAPSPFTQAQPPAAPPREADSVEVDEGPEVTPHPE